MKCLHCNQTINQDDINVSKDIVVCRKCDSIFSLSQDYNNNQQSSFKLNTPPKGAWIRQLGAEIRIGASTRSPLAFFVIPFMVVWSGGSLSGIYGTQLITGHFNPFLSLFGIPFLIGSVIFWSFGLMMVAGKVEVYLSQEEGKVFVGLGRIGWTKKFLLKEVDTVKEVVQPFRYPGGHNGAISLDGKRRISFGSQLNESRRYYVYRSLKQLLYLIKNKKMAQIIHS